MNYSSTRNVNKNESVSAAQAIKQGLANDGGLFMPDNIPVLSLEDVTALIDKNYVERAVRVLSLFLTDYSEDELRADGEAAYSESRFVGGRKNGGDRRARRSRVALGKRKTFYRAS